MKIGESQQSIIEETLEELSGLAFRGGRPWSRSEKRMYSYRYKQILYHIPVVLKNDRVLEVGLCGGALAFLLKRLLPVRKLFSLEYPATCKLYSKEFISKLEKEEIFLTPCDLIKDNLPWRKGFFEMVVFSEVIEHLVPTVAVRTIKEIHRVLKPQKILFLSTPNAASLLKRLNLMLGKNAIEFDPLLHEGGTFGHIREYTMGEIIKLLLSCGFAITAKRYASFDVQRSFFTSLEALAKRLYSPFGNGIIVLASKQKELSSS